MWFFDKSVSLRDSGVFEGLTDWHCHLLPGVDDGVKAIDETLRILALYESLGVREVWLTPHIMEDIPNATGTLQSKLAELKAGYKGSIALHLAAEYMLDHLFEERLRDDDLLPLGEERSQLLVETSYFNPPMGLTGILKRIKGKGYTPVLAHPERYIYMSGRDYKELKSLGIKFQLNLFSLVGMYGPEVQKKAEHLLKQGWYDMKGTDTHSLKTMERFLSAKTSKSKIGKLNF